MKHLVCLYICVVLAMSVSGCAESAATSSFPPESAVTSSLTPESQNNRDTSSVHSESKSTVSEVEEPPITMSYQEYFSKDRPIVLAQQSRYQVCEVPLEENGQASYFYYNDSLLSPLPAETGRYICNESEVLIAGDNGIYRITYQRVQNGKPAQIECRIPEGWKIVDFQQGDAYALYFLARRVNDFNQLALFRYYRPDKTCEKLLDISATNFSYGYMLDNNEAVVLTHTALYYELRKKYTTAEEWAANVNESTPCDQYTVYNFRDGTSIEMSQTEYRTYEQTVREKNSTT